MVEKVKILLIDDSNTYHELYKHALDDEIFDARFAQDGVSGLELYKSWKPEIILLDMEMPEMDGRAVLKEIRETLQDRSTTVIMQTSHSSKDAVMACAALGISGYIVKPPEPKKISDQIIGYCEKTAPDIAEKIKHFISKHQHSSPPQSLERNELEYLEEVEYFLKSGELSESHRRLLDRMAKQLELSVSRARELEKMILDPGSICTPEEEEYLEEIEFCLETGPIDETERVYLNNRREKLNISEERAAVLEQKVIEEREQSPDQVAESKEKTEPSDKQE